MIEELIAKQKQEEMDDFPALETRNWRSGDPDPLASLFPKKKVENLFLELDKDYE